MKLQKSILFLLVLMLSIIFVGCELIDSVFVNTKEVKASDLADYSGTAAGTEADVDAGLGYAMNVIGSTNPLSRVFADDYENVARILELSAPAVAAVAVPKKEASRTVSAGVDAAITNETMTLEGTIIKLTVAEAKFKGEIEFDKLEEPSEAKVKFTTSAEVQLEDLSGTVYDAAHPTGVVVGVADVRFNVSGNGNATTSLNTLGAATEVDYYTALDTSLGFSLNCDGYSGKYLINFKYVDSAVLSSTDLLEGSYTASESTVMIEVIVYNNSGTQIASKEYTADEFIAVVMLNAI